MQGPLVSIIIPIYNVLPYLDKCIQSACDQSYVNIEIILVNDGSTDGCKERCAAWAKKDSRIKVINKKNGGLSDARNAGLAVAKGEYIYFLDGDDYIEKSLLETALSYMDGETDLVYFQYIAHCPNGESKNIRYSLGNFSFRTDEERIEFILEKFLTYRIGWEAWSRIYRRDKIEKYNLHFVNNTTIFAEDLLFCLCYFSHVEKVVGIPEYLYHYIQREESIMGSNKKKINIGRMNELCKAALDYFKRFDDCEVFVVNFPTIYYIVMSSSIWSVYYWTNCEPMKFREKMILDIGDYNFYKQQQTDFFQTVNWRRKCLYTFQFKTLSQKLEAISTQKYFLDGKYFEMRIRNRLLNLFSKAINLYNEISDKILLNKKVD